MATAASSKASSANPANSANAANAAQAVTGSARVTMPDQNGSFHLNVPRGAVKHVQVVDVDMVLQLEDGSKVVLAGGAMGAMDEKSKIVFADASQDTGRLLDLVGKIPLRNNDQSLILNSDPVNTQDRANNSDSHGVPENHFTSNNNSAQVNPAATSQLAKIIQDNAGSLTSNGLQNLVLPSIPVPPAPPVTTGADSLIKQVSPEISERPGSVLTPIVVGPQTPAMTLNLLNLTTQTQVGSVLHGSGGSVASAIDGSNSVQFAPQVINAGNDVHTIYATSSNTQSDFIKIFKVNVTGDGTVKSVLISGVPSTMTILNAVNLGGGNYQITPAAGEKTFDLQVQYTTTAADPTRPTAPTATINFDVSVLTSDGLTHLLDSRVVVIKDASSYTDLTYLDPATGKSVWVLPAQGVPHEIHAGDGGVTIYGSNANDLLYGGVGVDTIIGGSGNTYFEGGAGADVLTGGTQGINTAGYKNSAAGVTIDLVTGVGTGGDAQGDVLSNIQNLIGSASSDTFVANGKVNRLDGGTGGSDTVSYAHSTAGVTVNLITGLGSNGDAEGDTYVHIQNVIGSASGDMFIANTQANSFNGGSGGSDTVSYASSAAGVTVNLSTGVGTGGSAQGDTYVHIQNVIGSAFADTFVGNIDVNNFDGGSGGQDTVSYANSAAGVSVNFVSGRGVGGDAEGDTYSHIQNVIGSAFDDVFIAGIDSVNFNGGSGGSDTVNYGASTGGIIANMVTMTGSGGYAQNNTYTNIQNIVGSSSGDIFVSGAGANHFDGGSGGSDTVSYASSNAGVVVSLFDGSASGGYAQGDTLLHIQNVIGSNFNDLFIASADNNRFDGGGGVNTVSYEKSVGGVTVDLTNTIGTGTGSTYANGDSYVNIQNLIGSIYDDIFIASADANRLDGGLQSVHNRVSYENSNAGVTVDLNYTDGTGTFGGYAAGDQLINVQDLTGSSGNDTFVASNVANNFDGGAGSNTVSYAASNAGVTIDLVLGGGNGGYANGDTYLNIQNIIGSTADDMFIANGAANRFDGLGGTNTVSYAKASDSIGVVVDLVNNAGSNGFAAGDTYANIQNVIGSTNDDTFIASSVANVFDGLQGSDTVSYVYSNAGVTVNLVTGLGANGYATGDTYANLENVIGSSFDDLFVASSDVNSFDGGTGTVHNRVSYTSSTAAVTIDLTKTDGTGTSGGFAQGDKFVNIQDLTGSQYDDTFVASNAANNFDGGTGCAHNRVSYAASAAGVTVDLTQTDGSGTSGGFAQGDTLVNIQDLTGSQYDDLFIASNVANYFDGGVSAAGSHNRVSYKYSDAGVTVDLTKTDGTGTSGGFAQGDKFVNIQDLTGSQYDDTFVASSDANNFDGGISATGSHNRVSYAASTSAVTVDLTKTDGTGTSGGFAQGDTLINIQDLTGSQYDDTFVASSDANNFDGGASVTGSHNRVSYAASTAAVTIDLTKTDGTGTSGGFAQGDKFINIQDLTGSQYDDTFVASSDANNFDGGSGSVHNRVSYAASATAVTVDLTKTDGTGTSGGFAQGDKLVNIQDLTGSSGDDTFIASSDGNYFDGGVSSSTSHNRVSYAASTAAVTVDLTKTDGTGTSGGFAQGDRFVRIQDLTGSQYDDTFVASSDANYLDGGASVAGSHNRVSYAASTAAVTVDLTKTDGTGTSGGFAQNDKLINIQDLTGSQYDDTFVASSDANNFDGGVSVAGSHNLVSYAASTSAVTVDLTKTDGTGTSGGFAQGDKFINIQDVTGSQYDDTFVASSSANNFDGGTSVTGSHNRVSYAASTAAVTVDLTKTDGTGTSGGFAQGDKFVNIQDVTGSQYNDTFVASSAANNFDGGVSAAGSHNAVSYAASTSAVTVDLTKTDGTGTSGGFAQGDTLINIQDLTGSQYDDTFVASADANYFDGGVSVTGSHNRVSYAASNAAVTVDLNSTNGSGTSGGYAAGDRFVNIQDITGSSGNDTFIANGVANNFDGGLGSDTVSYSASTVSVTVDLSSGGAGVGGFADGDTYTSIENVIGGSAADFLTGAATGATVLTGGGGGDTLTGVASNRANTYASYAGSAAVTVNLNATDGSGTSGGDAAGDKLSFIDNLIGSSNDDIFVANNQANNLNGGGGFDTVSYTSSDGGVTVNLNTGIGANFHAQGDVYTSIENVIGSGFADTLTGAGANKTILTGGGGGDTLTGVTANRANTFASYAGSASGVTVDLNATDGTGTSGGDAAGDKLSFIDNLIGSSFNDTFVANGQANSFDGGAGGVDTVSYLASTALVTVDLSNTTGAGTSGGFAQGDKFTGISNLIGSNFDDVFFASSAANAFEGSGHGANGDTVNYARSGNAVVVDLFHHTGSAGVDAAAGGGVSFSTGDTYSNIQNVVGSSYNDTFYGDSIANKFDGAGGTSDTVSYEYSNANGAIIANLGTHAGTGGDANGDTYTNIENLTGSAFLDSTLTGDANANILTAKGTATTNAFSGGGAASGTDVFNVVDGGTNSVAVGTGLNTINVSAGSHSSLGAQSDMVNQTTGLSNISTINGAAGTTTLHFADLGSSITLANFANKVTGITTLDMTSGVGTNIVITAADVISMGMPSGASSHILTVKMSGSESLQIAANGSDHYVYFPGTTDYAFYNASNVEVARIHLA